MRGAFLGENLMHNMGALLCTNLTFNMGAFLGKNLMHNIWALLGTNITLNMEGPF